MTIGMKDWKFGETAFLIAMMMVMMEKKTLNRWLDLKVITQVIQ